MVLYSQVLFMFELKYFWIVIASVQVCMHADLRKNEN